ncbi:MAG TPA: hypothetical protein VF316_00620, partial [Polyangiaceae bacterium]
MRLASLAVGISSAVVAVGCSLLTSLDDLGGSDASVTDAPTDGTPPDGAPEATCGADLNVDPANCGSC